MTVGGKVLDRSEGLAPGSRPSPAAHRTLVSLVGAQAAHRPEGVAVVDEDEQLSYGDLHARAGRLAHLLGDLGVGPDIPVGVCLERSTTLAVALLGTLRAGGACMPLDPSYPAQRIAAMLDDARPPVLLTGQELGAELPPYRGRIVRMDTDWSEVERHPPSPPSGGPSPDDLAYVIYTSGSRGEPKGVMLGHRALANHSVAVSRLYELGPADRVLQFCSLGFDVSVEEIFPTWATGGTVVFRPDDAASLGRAWLGWLARAGITVVNLPTAYWHAWVHDLHALREQVPADIRLCVVGGEKATGSAYRRWLEASADRVRWLNAYGPAEASVTATVFEPARDAAWPPDRDPPIGRPIDNVVVRVLDELGEPVRAGVQGELHIGGAGLARGYLGRADLTAKHFVRDPERPGERLYRTGDLVRMLDDGNLEFIGRADEQVKVRGFRVECREIQSTLARHDGVEQAAVLARDDEPGDRRLVAYVVPARAGPPTSTELRRFLSGRLPAHMVPSAFVRLDALPLTAHGKVDGEALPPPGDPRGELETEWVAPRTAAEQTIAAVWARILGVERIGVEDDFFELGGHSLQAIQVIAEVEQIFGKHVGVRSFFERPTVAGLADLIDAHHDGHSGPPPLKARPRRSELRIPLTLSQEHMWALESRADPPGLFNVTALHRFRAPVQEPALRQALAHLAERHETLRTSFHHHGEESYQSVATSIPVDLAVCDLSAEPAGRRQGTLHRLIAAQDSTAFDVTEAPLFRSILYRLDDRTSVVAVTFDHLICDGTSAYIFLDELAAAYEALASGTQPRLRALPVQYGDFAVWQRTWFTEERLRPQLEYWKRTLAGMPLGPAVPFDRIPDQPSRRIASHGVSVIGEVYEGLHRLAKATASTMFVVAGAALQALLSRVGGMTDVVLSTTLSGRRLAQVEGLIGCFHGIGRIRTDLSGDPRFETVVGRTRDTVLELFENQDVPFIRVREAALHHMATGGLPLLRAVPIEFQYFRTAHDGWTPGAGVVERPGQDKGPDELFFRGHMQPLTVTMLDDGTQLWGELSYKTDFYEDATIEGLAEGLADLAAAVTRDPRLRLSELPVGSIRAT